jgi:putative addiction module antidote
MVRKIFKTGNSMVVSLPRDSLDFLGLAEGAEVSVDLDQERRQIVIAPVDTALQGVDETFARQVAEFIEQYRPALESLAKR